MMQGPGSALSTLVSLVGSDVIVSSRDALAPFETDQRQRYRGRALALARPRSTSEVAKILAYCNRQRIGVVPIGGNTGLCGGATPDESGTQLLLSVDRMNQVRSVDTANESITVEAGCTLAQVQAAAIDAERFFPLSLAAEGSCQIGGNLSTNAGGVNVLRYGMARELLLDLEVVLADGRVLDLLSPLRKDNTGYDLKSLFVGSEGTLGVITAATLKLFASQRDVATALASVADPEAAVRLLAGLRRHCGDAIGSFELLPRVAIDMVRRHIPACRDLAVPSSGQWLVLLEASTADGRGAAQEWLQRGLIEAMAEGTALEVIVAGSSQQREQLWRLRESIPEAQRRDGASMKHDISVPIAVLAQFMARAASEVVERVPEGFLVAYGHLGDGNLHFNVNQRSGTDTALFRSREPDIRRCIHDLVHELGGSFSAEHGIGRLKVEELERYASPVELELMRALKRVFDPNGILNPGKVLRAEVSR
jgi:FAD/FMN-containing dehydrogenase